MTFGSGDLIRLRFTVPISGWSSNTVMSQDTDTRVVAARYTHNGTGAFNGGSVRAMNTLVFDTHSAYNTSTGLYTAPVSGRYRFSGIVQTNSVAWVAGNNARVYFQKNASGTYAFGKEEIMQASNTTNRLLDFDVMVELNAGDTFSMVTDASVASTFSGNADRNYLQVERLSGPAVVAASETVAARAYLSANQTGINPNASYVKLNFNTRDHDTHNAFDTAAYRYNVPSSGRYLISAVVAMASTNVLASFYELYLYKNNAAHSLLDRDTPAVSTGFGLGGQVVLNLNAGDYIEFYLYGSGNNTASTLTAAGGATSGSSISIARI